MTRYAIILLHRDLRVSDHAPLGAAIAQGFTPIPLHVVDPAESCGGAAKRWLHEALADLDRTLRLLGSRLIVRSGNSEDELLRLIAETGATAVYRHRRYDPRGRAWESRMEPRLRASGIDCRSFPGDCLHEPHAIATKSGTPFRVFTPFRRRCAESTVDAPIPAPATLPPIPPSIHSRPLDELGLKPITPWDAGIVADWDMTRRGAEKRLSRFFGDGGDSAPVRDYEFRRDIPGEDGTSRLSPYLHFGQLSVREVHAAAMRAGGPGTKRFLDEIGWREFARHLLFHFPDTPENPLDRRHANFRWAEAPELLRAWEQGRTGVPIVDAGMRQLRATGWMHNRVRMIAASYLVKNLLIDWRHGAARFMDNLVDADLAQNTMGWQWVAGCGADAAPFFRVFNPVLQGQKFDPQGDYVRKYVPELKSVPAKWIHSPWAIPDTKRRPDHYPSPIVDLALSRLRALSAYDTMRRATAGV